MLFYILCRHGCMSCSQYFSMPVREFLRQFSITIIVSASSRFSLTTYNLLNSNAGKLFQTQPILWTMQAVVYTGNVLALYMTKPPGFKYNSGMYLFVKCPDVANFEW